MISLTPDVYDDRMKDYTYSILPSLLNAILYFVH